jgi:hypothetical protein
VWILENGHHAISVDGPAENAACSSQHLHPHSRLGAGNDAGPSIGQNVDSGQQA